MEHNEIVAATVAYVRNELANAEGGHDWWHINRVWKNSLQIAHYEKADLLIVEVGALLHDIADAKFHGGDESLGPKKAMKFMKMLDLDEKMIDHVVKIIENISYKGGHKASDFMSPELAIVQDADRLDALGAIGIARAFNYGGYKNRALFDPDIKPNLQMSKEEYKSSSAPTINHFYEKLLLLKDLMNTEAGKRIAEERHRFMLQYLEQFYGEWEGKK